MGNPELGRVISVNTTQNASEVGLQISAVKEDYIPRSLQPTSTTDHEAIHAGLGDEGEVAMVTIVPGPGYNGLTRFHRPNALAALGPHAVGAHGTSWDVMIAYHIGGGSIGAARNEVANRHAEIVEIADELSIQQTMTGSEIDRARKRAQMKLLYGEKATVTVKSNDGETVIVKGVKVEGDKTAIPIEIVDFQKRKETEQEKKEIFQAI